MNAIADNVLKSYALAFGLGEPLEKDCPECKGEGSFPYSSCCGADIDNGLCTECLKPANNGTCEDCKGTGKVPLTSDDMDDIRDNELIANAEIRKDN